MPIYDAIKNFNEQFAYEPIVENGAKFGRFEKFVIAGMGGSGHAADLIKALDPALRITVHRDYGLPAISEKELEQSLIIASSYSGNTEESLDALQEATKRELHVAAISIGGKLLGIAKREGIPYIQLPDTGIQPRTAVGFSIKALIKLLRQDSMSRQLGELSHKLDPHYCESAGKDLGQRLHGFVPLIYASTRNGAVANNWKIRFNETGKIPAFWNVVPELNHNEMNGFDRTDSTKALSGNFYTIILKDADDDPRVLKRMEVLASLYRERGISVETISMEGENRFVKIFSSLILADWTSYFLGESYGVETEQVPMVEEFKDLIQK